MSALDEKVLAELTKFMLQTGMTTDHLSAFQELCRACYNAGAADRQAQLCAYLRSFATQGGYVDIWARSVAARIESGHDDTDIEQAYEAEQGALDRESEP